MIDDGKIKIDKDLVFQFDTLDVEKSTISPTVRVERELATYGVETSINLRELQKVKELAMKMQQETIKILAE